MRVLHPLIVLAWLHALAGCGATVVAAHAPSSPRPYSLVEVARGRPDAVVDLGDDADAALVSARWRHAAVSFVETGGVDPGPDSRPVPSATSRTHDLSIAPRREGWDAAAWEPFEPHDLGARRGHGHLSMGWVRLELVLPERLGATAIQGATVAFEITADDYGEVWVNGRLPHQVGDSGGHVVAGWNAPNRVVLTTSAEPGMRFDVAVLVVNGPISRSPGNFYWVRQAMLDVYSADARTDAPAEALLLETDGAARETAGADPMRAERIAAGFVGLGPVLFVPEDGGVLVSDVEGDTLYRFAPDTGRLSVVQTHVALTAMALDADGRLIARLRNGEGVRYEGSGAITVLDEPPAAPAPAAPAGRLGPEPLRGMTRGADGLYVATADSLYRLRSATDVAVVSPPTVPAQPPPAADADDDGVPDDRDACPSERGQLSERAERSGCPSRVCLDCGVYRPRITPVPFAPGSAALGAGADSILAAVAELLLLHPELRTIDIEGHADEGERPSAAGIADERAAAVLEWLAAHGVVHERLRRTRSVVQRAPEGAESEARVELRIAEQ